MKRKHLAELLRYCNPKHLYVVTWNNVLKLLICPFKVKAIYDVASIKKGKIVLVDEVKITMELKTVFIINGKAYFYYHFDILID